MDQSISPGGDAAGSGSGARPHRPEPALARAPLPDHGRDFALALARQMATRARFLRLWREHRGHLQALGRRWLAGNPIEAEDALSDVFCKACASYGEDGATITDERAWLSRMLHNRCMDAHRRRRAATKIFQDAPSEEESAESGAGWMSPAAVSPEEELLNAELGRAIHSALAELPESLRGPIIMRLIHDESYGKVAKTYDISMANARKRIQQGRALLRARLISYLSAGR